jgi:hypothetical protein
MGSRTWRFRAVAKLLWVDDAPQGERWAKVSRAGAIWEVDEGKASARCLPLSVAFERGRNGPRSLPLDFLALASAPVGIDDYDLPHPAHGLRTDHLFESFHTPR